MTNTKVDPNKSLKESFENLMNVSGPSGTTGLIVGAVAQYGVHLVIKRFAHLFMYHGKLHQKIAVAVATYIITWACQRKIEKLAYEFTAEMISITKRIIGIFRDAPARAAAKAN